ncbi:uncharacterized protein Nmag_3960 (plasmid) [Natrialba magadii ATCC 43099]|uniref:Uncharacterized protein n=1 Tax=Natrialba magadii (strain ATCC 43099 / DSM 3394 / CCM 3739 / CIP 104546 / IAM 13178 / JCM 8861 / NBRC 102185 / NCIMB 2190 / MS3) TaxID=547559 RepID=D3T1N9_NATMM|nr:uncharacterized protein Nmag_3960 [Natrialba magadii ATCC 43099]
MEEGNNQRKVAAVCDGCGTAYAAIEREGGTIQPIGHPNGCCDGAGMTVLSDREIDREIAGEPESKSRERGP